MAIVYGIVIVRSIIAFSGTMCCFLGYRLFFLVTERQGELNLKLGTEKSVKVQDLAPGIWFAGFGSAILVASLWAPMQLAIDNSPESGSAKPDVSAREVHKPAAE